LAVDDSVTMRKVLEITFTGEDFRVVTADTSQGAIGKMAENPQVCVVDTVLGGEDGYTLVKELRKRNPSTSIIMLASRYAPYDQARGRDAGADDWADKPFDTQQLIDKVRKIMLAKEASGPVAAPVAAPAPAPVATPPAPPAAAAYRPPQPIAAAPMSGLGKGTQPSLSSAVPGRTGTLVFGENASSAPPAPVPASRAATAAPAAPVAPAAAVAGAVNGALSGKLGDLGLTPQQADAVLALSREVVERVVWEVVPQLAEAIIKEEIARLTKE
ncbi:MAG: response regulator receiver protein, partial [Labilithrix sp.]|nr:response regulator receiver protein [Labilithrix sp.]